MPRRKRHPGKPKGAKTKFPGVCADARYLEVNVRSLQAVLLGERKSRRMILRYRALKREQMELRPTARALKTNPGHLLNALSGIPRDADPDLLARYERIKSK